MADEFRKTSDRASAQISQVLVRSFNSVFVKHPILESVRWTQYTPYFNDGDVCEFGVYDIIVKITGVGYCDSCSTNNIATIKPIFDDINLIERNMLELKLVMQIAFGDHTQITIDRNGKITQEVYEHD